MEVSGKLTVLFEEPFWVGIYERADDEGLSVSRVVFGAEPKDYEVYSYFNRNWKNLRFSPCVETKAEETAEMSPKRRQRVIARQLHQTGIGTKAQQAIKLLQEQSAEQRIIRRRTLTEQEKEQRFLLRQQKKRLKHRGR